MNQTLGRRAALHAAAAGTALALLLAGCAGPKPRALPPVFYPPPPETPRVQFLLSLNTSADAAGERGFFERFVFTSESERTAEPLLRPYGMAFHNRKLYVCDSGARRIVVFDFRRRRFSALGSRGQIRVALPVNIFIAPDGEKYVTDPERGQIVVYDADDYPVRALNGPGGMKPCDVHWRNGELFVTDLKSNSIKVLDPRTGQLLREFGKRGEQPGQFVQPTNLAFGPKGRLFVCDTFNARVQELDPDGTPRGAIGSLGTAMGLMVRPKGIALDREGRLYEADAATDSVQLYDPQGRLLLVIGGPGEGPGDLSLPAKVIISYEGVEPFQRYAAPGFKLEYLIFVTSHLGPNKVAIYGFGRGAGPDPSAPLAPPTPERAAASHPAR